jgi:hypothetical protein
VDEDDDFEPVCYCPLCRDEMSKPASQVMFEWGWVIQSIFDECGNERPEVVRDQLVDMLRENSWISLDLLALLADLLDPAGKTTWQLKLSRRRGRPRRLSMFEAVGLWADYERRLQELKNENRASPAKTARGELAAQHKMTDEEVRAIIDRVLGKKVRTKRAGRKPRSIATTVSC